MAWSLAHPGWCTPTILVVVFGVLAIISLAIQLAMNKDPSKFNALLGGLIFNIIWTIAMGALLFWLCQNGKIVAAWWIFGLLYLLPIVIVFLAILGAFIVQPF